VLRPEVAALAGAGEVARRRAARDAAGVRLRAAVPDARAVQR
jgi:hypothetical protein